MHNLVDKETQGAILDKLREMEAAGVEAETRLNRLTR